MTNLTVVHLTPEEAALFIQFQKRFAFVKVMESIGAFDLKSGSITINFDHLGQIGSIDKQEHLRLQK